MKINIENFEWLDNEITCGNVIIDNKKFKVTFEVLQK